MCTSFLLLFNFFVNLFVILLPGFPAFFLLLPVHLFTFSNLFTLGQYSLLFFFLFLCMYTYSSSPLSFPYPLLRPTPFFTLSQREVYNSMPHRREKTIYHCAHRLFSRPTDVRWAPEDVERLKELFQEHGSKWALIGASLGRSPWYA